MTYLLDTDTCIDVLRGRTDTVSRISERAPDDMAVSTITVYELEVGVASAREPERERGKVSLFLDTLHVLPFLATAAECAARVRRELALSGTPIGPYDTLIAGHALATQLTLVTSNTAEFGRIPGLSLLSWRRSS